MDSGEYVNAEVFLDYAFLLFIERIVLVFLGPRVRRSVDSRGYRWRSSSADGDDEDK